MSKSVRIPERSYEQADELRQKHYESLTNVMAVAIDRLYQAEKERTMERMERERIMNELNADDWFTVAVTFRDLDEDSIERMIDSMFQCEDNKELAATIYDELN